MSCWALRMPVGPCPSDAITLFGAQVGWSPDCEHFQAAHCPLCGHRLGRDERGFSVVIAGGAVDDCPESVVAVCESCSYSNRDRTLVPEKQRSIAEARKAPAPPKAPPVAAAPVAARSTPRPSQLQRPGASRTVYDSAERAAG